jgi:hypothetical protein
MSAPHTLGPWTILEDAFAYPGIEADGGTFSVVILGYPDHGDDGGVRGRTEEEALANAHLIAAAPDLLEALESMLAITDRDHVVWDEAREAIAKAKGETK